MTIALLFNPVSGRGRALVAAQAIQRGLVERGFRVELLPTERRPASEWLRPKLAGIRHLVVAGGDGAVRLAAPEAARAGVPIWHAPCGTENLFARAFGMSRGAAAIAAAVGEGRTRRIDLATANDEHFAIMASVGFDAEVVHRLSAARTGGISHLSYARPILELVGRWQPARLSWTVDGEREELGTGLVVVGNLPNYGVGLNPAREARPDDGLLDAVFIPARGAFDLLPWVPLLRTGLHLRHPMLRMRRGAEIVLAAAGGARLQLDGDAAGPAEGVAELRLAPVPSAVEVLLPASA